MLELKQHYRIDSEWVDYTPNLTLYNYESLEMVFLDTWEKRMFTYFQICVSSTFVADSLLYHCCIVTSC